MIVVDWLIDIALMALDVFGWVGKDHKRSISERLTVSAVVTVLCILAMGLLCLVFLWVSNKL